MLFIALFFMLFGGSEPELGPVLTDLDAARARVGSLELSVDRASALENAFDAVHEAAQAEAETLDAAQQFLRDLARDHAAGREQLASAVRAWLDADRRQTDAALDAYFELRSQLTAEQWAALAGK